MSPPTVPLKRFFEPATGGSWGVEPEEGEVVARCIRGTDFDYDRLRVSDGRAPERGFSRRDFKLRSARPGDLIIEKSGGGEQQPVGRAVLFLGAYPAVPTNFAGRLRTLPDVDARFACYVLASLYSDGRTRAAIKQTTGIQNLDLAALLSNPVMRPALPEQQAIADFLDTETACIDALIAKKRRLIELLDEHWGVEVMESTTRIDGGAGRMALRRVVQSTVGGAWGNDPGAGEVDALCVRGTDFDTPNLEVNTASAPVRGLTQTEFASRRLLPGDLIIEKSGGGDKSPVGRVVQWSSTSPAVPTNFAARIRPAAKVDSRFLAYVFRATYEIGLTRAWIKQTTGIQNLDVGGLLSEKWTIPTLGDQRAIAKHLDAATDYRLRGVALLSRQIDLLAEHRQALITSAVTGELSVPQVAA